MTVLRRVVASELGQYASLLRWIARRPNIPRHATPFPYVGAVSVLLWAFIVGSAIEVVVVHVILPWERIRLVADVLGIWGVVWMLGLAASLRIHPHLVGPTGLRVRNGHSVDLLVPWDSIASVQVHERGANSSRTIQVEEGLDGPVLSVVVDSRTNVEVVLRHPVAWRDVQVTDIRLYADDAHGLVAAVNNHPVMLGRS